MRSHDQAGGADLLARVRLPRLRGHVGAACPVSDQVVKLNVESTAAERWSRPRVNRWRVR